MVNSRPFWSGSGLLCCAVRFAAISAVLALLVVSDLGAQRSVPSQEPLALTNASVVDVRGGTVTRGATVLMRGGRIESIAPPSPGGSGAAGSGAPADVRTLDLRGRYVVPGLIDAHVHIGSAA